MKYCLILSQLFFGLPTCFAQGEITLDNISKRVSQPEVIEEAEEGEKMTDGLLSPTLGKKDAKLTPLKVRLILSGNLKYDNTDKIQPVSFHVIVHTQLGGEELSYQVKRNYTASAKSSFDRKWTATIEHNPEMMIYVLLIDDDDYKVESAPSFEALKQELKSNGIVIHDEITYSYDE